MFIDGPSPLCFSPVNGVFHETTKPFSPKGCLSSTTSMKPSSRSALDLSVSKNRGGDTSQPSSEGTQEHHWSWIRQAHRVELLLLWGRALFWNPIDFWPNTDHWHLYGSPFRYIEDSSYPSWNWPFYLHICLVCNTALRPSFCHSRSWLCPQL